MLTKDYEILEEIDRGRFGIVSKCKSLKTHEFFAVKSVDKSTLSGDELDKQSLINEPKALKMVASSSYVTRLHTTYDTPTHLHLILDYFPHPSLHSLRLPLPEPDTRPVMFSLLHALLHCHLHGVVHRDIKPDNVLFDPSSLSLKLCDFGSCAFLQPLDHLQHSNARATLSSDCDGDCCQQQQHSCWHTDSDLLLVHLHQQQKQHSNARATLTCDRCQQQHNCWPTDSDHCQQKKQHSWHSNARATLTGVVGTPYYVAPEILRGEPYDEKVDVWSAGVVLYVLIAGFPPFYGESVEEVFDKVLRGNLRFPSWVFRNFSPSVKDLLRRMICKDVNSRFSVQQALRHPWFTANGGGHSVPMI